MEENISKNIKNEAIPQSSIGVPLFIKKLWKMVNDKEAENIISWDSTGHSFIIHDQVEFITQLLPHYFKHNNMASFVRQLNFYSFHKVPNIKNEIQFAHDYFIKGMPEVLPFIRRKNPLVKPKTVPNHFNEEDIQDLLKDIKDLKGKHTLVNKDLSTLKQENLALWTELNSLRLKYSKQSTIINMLIHFLITYIHSHQTAFSKPNIQVSTDHLGNNIKVGPTLLEIDYKKSKKAKNPYSVLKSGTSNSVTYALKLPENCGPEVKRSRKTTQGIDELVAMKNQDGFHSMNRLQKLPRSGITYSIQLPGQTEKPSQAEIQRSLLEILKQNESLCEEDAEDYFTELESEIENLVRVKEEPDLMEEIITDDIPESDNYTVSHPAENLQEVSSETQVLSPQAEPIIESPPDNVVNTSQEFQYNTPKFITKEIPINSSTGTYTITYPDPEKCTQDLNKNKVSIVDHVILPKSTNTTSTKMKVLPKFIKIPLKNIKGYNSKKIKTNTVTNPIVTQPTLTNLASTQSTNMANAEGTLLEILKENEKLTNDGSTIIPGENLNIQQKTNLETLIDNTDMDQALEQYLLDADAGKANLLGSDSSSQNQPIVEPLSETMPSATKKSGKNINTNLNILENPKEHLRTYVDSTQEEIDMLQDILNNLTSTDFSEILNSEPTQFSVDDIPVIDEDVGSEHIEEQEPSADYNINESVDKYFKNPS